PTGVPWRSPKRTSRTSSIRRSAGTSGRTSPRPWCPPTSSEVTMPVYKIQRSRRGDTRAVAVYDGGTRPTKEEEVRRYLEGKAELREGSHVLRSMKNLEVDPPAGPRSPVLHGQEAARSEEHTSELQSRENLVCRLLLEKKKAIRTTKAMAT